MTEKLELDRPDEKRSLPSMPVLRNAGMMQQAHCRTHLLLYHP